MKTKPTEAVVAAAPIGLVIAAIVHPQFFWDAMNAITRLIFGG